MKFSKEIKIGLTAVGAIAFLIWGVNFLKGRNIFGDNRTFKVVYDDVTGLVPASPVTLRGQRVGQVASTEIILEGENAGRILCHFTVDYPGLRIPIDSRARFYSVDVLGTKGIKLELGASKEAAQPGDFLISAKDPSLSESVDAQIAPLKQKAESLIGSIDSMVTIVSGVLGDNKGELDQSFQSVRRAILKFESTAKNIDELIATERYHISSIFAKVDQISGTLAANSGKINSTIENFAKISDSLASADFAATINKAKVTIDELSKVMESINRGEGTLGHLVKNDSLFNQLVQTNEEVQRLIENIKDHPYRYLHFSVFGKREKGLKLDSRDEKKLKQMLKNQPNPAP